MYYFTYKSFSSSSFYHWIIVILFNVNVIPGSKKSHHSLSVENSERDFDKLNQDYVGMDYNEESSIQGKKYLLEVSVVWQNLKHFEFSHI